MGGRGPSGVAHPSVSSWLPLLLPDSLSSVGAGGGPRGFRPYKYLARPRVGLQGFRKETPGWQGNARDARESNENTPKIRFLRWRLWAIVSVPHHARSPEATHPIDRSATKTSSAYLDIIEAPVSGVSRNIPVRHGHGVRDERPCRGVPIVNGTGALRARAGCGPLARPAGNLTT